MRIARIGKATVQGQLLSLAIEQAVKALRDEKVRQQVLVAGTVVADRVRAAYAERVGARGPTLQDPPRGSAEPSLWDKVGAPFGHDRLVSRMAKLRDAIDQVRQALGPAAISLTEVDLAVSRLEVAIAAAQHLPLLSRQRAHVQVSRQLHQLEQAVFDAAMAGPPPPALA